MSRLHRAGLEGHAPLSLRKQMEKVRVTLMSIAHDDIE